MSTPFFIIGTTIFLTYAAILFYVILGQHKKQSKNPSELDFRKSDTLDTDGMGDYSRFGTERTKK
jgi:hypothetical protein